MVSTSIIKAAIKAAEKSDHHRAKVGAVIYDKNKILSIGRNYIARGSRKIHPKYQSWKGSIHAEVSAILNAKRDLRGFSILVLRVTDAGEFRFSKP